MFVIHAGKRVISKLLSHSTPYLLYVPSWPIRFYFLLNADHNLENATAQAKEIYKRKMQKYSRYSGTLSGLNINFGAKAGREVGRY